MFRKSATALTVRRPLLFPLLLSDRSSEMVKLGTLANLAISEPAHKLVPVGTHYLLGLTINHISRALHPQYKGLNLSGSPLLQAHLPIQGI